MASSSSGRRQSQRTVAGTPSHKQPPASTALLSHPTIMALLTTEQNPYQCGLCSVTFSVNMELVTHVRDHSRTKPYQCGYCKDSYSSNWNLVLHIEKHRSTMLQKHPPHRATHGAGTTGHQSPSTKQGVSLLPATTHQSPGPGILVSATTHQSPQPGTSLLLCSVSNSVQGPEGRSKDSAMAADCERESSGGDAASSPASSVGPDSDNDAPIVKKSPHGDSSSAEEVTVTKPGNSALCDCEEIIKLEPVSNQETEEAADKPEAVQSENNDEGPLEERQAEPTLAVNSTLTHQHRKVQGKKSTTDTDRPFVCDLCGAGFKVARYVTEHKRHVHNQRVKKKLIDSKLGESLVHNQTVKKKRNDVGLGESSVSNQELAAEDKPEAVESENDDEGHLEESQVEPTLAVNSTLTHQHRKVQGKKSTTDTDRPFVCDLCGAGFKVARYVTEHKRHVHNQRVKKKLIDSKLGESLVHNQTVKKKRNDVGLGESSVSNQKTAAEDKPEAVESENDDEDHLEERQVEPTLAVNSTLTHQQLKVQGKKSTTDTDRPYVCDLCGAGFKVARYVTEHKRHVHNQRVKKKLIDSELGESLVHNQTVKKKRNDGVGLGESHDDESNLAASMADRPESKEARPPPPGVEIRTKENQASALHATGSTSTLTTAIFGANQGAKDGNAKPFGCNHCQARFKLRRYLCDHMRHVHKLRLLLPGQKARAKRGSSGKKCDNESESCDHLHCHLCNSTFRLPRYLRDHQRLVHNIWVQEPRVGYGKKLIVLNDPGDKKTGLPVSEDRETRDSINSCSGNDQNKKSRQGKYVCDLCGDSFTVRRQFCTHKSRVHKVLGRSVSEMEDALFHEDPGVFMTEADWMEPQRWQGLRNSLALTSPVNITSDVEGDADTPHAGNDLQGGEKTPLHTKSCECSFCGKLMFSQGKLRRHLEDIHSLRRPFRCKKCSLCFKTSHAFERHSAKVHPEEKPFLCQHCSARFETQPEMCAHVGSHHTGFHCAHCPAQFNNKKLLSKHLFIWHADIYDASDEVKSFSCPQCSHTCGDEQDLNAHILVKHKKPFRKSLSCSHCQAQFKSKRVLQAHLRSEHSVHTTFQCDQCGKRFKLTQDLKKHWCQPRECPICQRKFSSQATYNHHAKEMHVNRLSFTCELCGKTFARAINLTYHQNSKHFNRRPYTCDICHKGFTSHPGLSAHKIRHREKKRYNCPHCDLKFYFKNNLERHALTHTDLKIHSCVICNRMYKSPTAMRYHMKNTHQYKPPDRNMGKIRLNI